ncbi:hypothetical protein HHI36_010519, partial [Cryptolaemus montrouzieri]
MAILAAIGVFERNKRYAFLLQQSTGSIGALHPQNIIALQIMVKHLMHQKYMNKCVNSRNRLLDLVFSDIDSTVVGVASDLLVNNCRNHVALHINVPFLAEKERLDYRDVQFMFNRDNYIGMNSFSGSCDGSVDNDDIDRTV